MYKRNDGLTGDQILQNQFTAFLNTALCNTRKAYLRGRSHGRLENDGTAPNTVPSLRFRLL